MMNIIDRLLWRNSELYKFNFEKYQFFYQNGNLKSLNFGGFRRLVSTPKFPSFPTNTCVWIYCSVMSFIAPWYQRDKELAPIFACENKFRDMKTRSSKALDQISSRRSIRENIILHRKHKSKSYLRWKSLIESEVSFSVLTHHMILDCV